MVRDPIHGDIRVTALEAAVIDTRVFQRLRYIRQNGLLHFVFPGAVHTRFAHSIGTMSVADRVFSRFMQLLDVRQNEKAFGYVGSVFRLAALLHDVGHCAFSHSSESALVRDPDDPPGSAPFPLLQTLRERLAAWQRQAIISQLASAVPGRLDAPATHEDLGIALIQYLFEKDAVVELCKRDLGVPASSVATDVCALINGHLRPSNHWITQARAAHAVYEKAERKRRAFGKVRVSQFPDDLLRVLHSLISGTLDVDRMDYLQRDSYYCGVTYGKCDIDILIGNLSLGGIKGHLVLFLNRKAVDALDDFLWSRYQLFVQVLNHKANVALNSMLSAAFSHGISDGHLSRPKTMGEYLLYTDDSVMSKVRAVCHQADVATRQYAKTLVDRKLPLHLGSVDSPASVEEELKIRKTKARAAGVKLNQITVAIAESVLVKGDPLPWILEWDRSRRRHLVHDFAGFSHFLRTGVPAKRVLHYFVDRDASKVRRSSRA